MSDVHVTKAGPAASIEQLPQELVDRIIDQLGPNIQSLKTVALLSRRWLPHSLYSLSQCAWLRIRPGEEAGASELIRALDEDRSFAQKIVRLAIENVHSFSVHAITALPHLRELRIRLCAPYEGDLGLRGQVQPADRTLAIIEVCNVPLALAHALLQKFSTVDTLLLRNMNSTGPLPDPPSSSKPYYVRNLDISNIDTTVLQYLTAALHSPSLRSLTVDMYTMQQPWAHPALVHDFVQAVGHALEEYHHNLCKPFIYVSPDLPALTACTNLASVSLELDVWSCEREQGRIAMFVRALPARTRRFKVTFWYDISGEDGLVEVAEMVEWTGLFEGLGQCAGLVCFEVVVRSNRRRKAHIPPFPDLASSLAAQALVLEKLPARVRSLTKFP
ncbi:hypothetical protein PsYK624_115230 [Phanerochaete sordida]|uniref:F-box domain-containing protein n=1 Tax=Phanerochaete sordida TaxID=48140 RepID=A0A9P3GJD8_9APHY|nr:hypothetical protein PsYK624_115230 [Phanerochaete sordida]